MTNKESVPIVSVYYISVGQLPDLKREELNDCRHDDENSGKNDKYVFISHFINDNPSFNAVVESKLAEIIGWEDAWRRQKRPSMLHNISLLMIRLADKNRNLQESLLKAEEEILRLKAQVAGRF